MNWYTNDPTFDTVLAIGFGFAAFTFIASLFVKSPYGRFASNKMGINLNPKFGWWLMEIPATLVFVWFYAQGPRALDTVPLILAGLWVVHYGNRGWFFPLAIRNQGKKSTFSISVLLLGMFVTGMHGYLHARWFSELAPHLNDAWLQDPRLWIGLFVYACGFGLLFNSEWIIRHLRKAGGQPLNGGDGYAIPYGGGFRWVSSPQYLGEMLAWVGLAIASWGLPGLVILAITIANLGPRALATHRWYKEKFADYPKGRKALIPFVL